MKIKRFRAKTFAEALKLVKKELSEDAIILSSDEKKGKNPYVEVTAAVDYEIDQMIAENLVEDSFNDELTEEKPDNEFIVVEKEPIKASTKAALKKIIERVEIKPEPIQTPPPPSPPPSIPTPPQYSEADLKNIANIIAADLKTHTSGIHNEIESLRDSIEDMRNLGYEVSLSPNKKKMLNFLMERSIKEEYALRLCERARDISELHALIISDLKIKPQTTGGAIKKAVMLVGPTGVGKTTTIAKLAAVSIKNHQKAAIINYDSFRIGAVEQSRIYSRIMGIPLLVATNAEELTQGLLRFSKDREIIYIDTAGKNPKDEASLNDLIKICGAQVPETPIEVHLIMSANSDDRFILDAYKHYKRLPINYLGFTKIDEAVRFGS
ncbi:MAG: flagellar biosynthesis protein FlhF, partial [Nitrospirae bacterium]|nr:flagellar biosynthesis protein FlhF [Nitrospirota bacterium]